MSLESHGPLYSTMKVRFLISSVANRPSPVRERPIRNSFLRGMGEIYRDSHQGVEHERARRRAAPLSAYAALPARKGHKPLPQADGRRRAGREGDGKRDS